MRRVLPLALLGLVLTSAALTAAALEWSGVAVLETRAPDGSTRATRVWFAEARGEIWLEAGAPENPWFRDIQRDPRISFSASGPAAPYRAAPLPNPEGHARIRALLRSKYGVRDWWVGRLFDTSRSVAVKLVPTAENEPGVQPMM